MWSSESANSKIVTLPKTNSSHLKIGHTKKKLISQPSIFRGYVMLVSGKVSHQWFNFQLVMVTFQAVRPTLADTKWFVSVNGVSELDIMSLNWCFDDDNIWIRAGMFFLDFAMDFQISVSKFAKLFLPKLLGDFSRNRICMNFFSVSRGTIGFVRHGCFLGFSTPLWFRTWAAGFCWELLGWKTNPFI